MNLVAKNDDGEWMPVRSSFRMPVTLSLGSGEMAIPADDAHISTGMNDKSRLS